MWLSESTLQRIRELEQRLMDSVPRAVYDVSLARIAELERRVDWQSDMLLRRGQTLPLPPVRGEEKPPEPPARLPSDTDIAKAEAIRQAGQAMNKSKQEIGEAIRQQLGWTEEDLARAIQGNGHL